MNKMLVDMESKNKAANKINEDNSGLMNEQRSLLEIRQEKINFLTKKNMGMYVLCVINLFLKVDK